MRFVIHLSFLAVLLMTAGCDSSLRTGTERSADPTDRDGTEEPGEDSGSFSFDFSLISTTGETVSKADFAGKVLVVDIWGTWCPPCRAEVPHFVELQEELGSKGVQIVGINYEGTASAQEALAEIAAFTDKIPVNYPLLLGTEEVKEQVPNFEGYPTTIFIDRTGKVRLSVVGARSKRELQGIIEKLLDEEAA
jgi:thiol-disulfide isomerase/thioredoxin